MWLNSIIRGGLKIEGGIWNSGNSGSWSLLKRAETDKLVACLGTLGCLEAVREICPEWEELIFGLKRAAGVGMLDIEKGDVVVDVGCMWGALTVPIARTGCRVIGIDQTLESLQFLRKRLEEENMNNVELVCADCRKIDFKTQSVDKFIVNGVLEWISEKTNVAFEKRSRRKDMEGNIWKGLFYFKSNKSPKEMQRKFLRKLNSALKKGGILYLAIENRYDVAHFFGQRDPHTGLRFVNILSRPLQTALSLLVLKRPYLTWIYSEKELKHLLHSSGFGKVKICYAFPSYQFPELILSDKRLKGYNAIRFSKSRRLRGKVLWWLLETTFYKVLRCNRLSPAFVVIAYK